MKEELARRKPFGWTPRSYRPGDEAKILPLYALAFQGLHRSTDYWRWKFQENPAGARVIVAEDAGGQILGLVAGLHARAHAEGRPVTVSQAVDVMVAPGERRGLRKAGMFVLLLARLIEEATGADGAALMFGLPNQDSDRVTQEVFGWQNLHQVTRVARRLDGPGAIAPAWLARRRYRVRPVTDFGGAADALWTRCREHVPFATIRGAGYLTWRYLRCPYVAYHPYVAWDRWRDRPAGLAILRLGWEGQPLGAIVDWLVPRGEVGPAAVLLHQIIMR